MKNIAILLITAVLISCGGEKKTSSLDELKQEKRVLVNKIDSLNKALKSVEKKINKLDTTKRMQLVTTLPVKNDVFRHYLEIQGVVHTDKNIVIHPEMGGTVTSIKVKEGQHVRAGQVLVQLDDSSLQSNIKELQTQLNLAITTFERQERLWAQKIGSEMQYLQTKTQKEALESSLEALKTQTSKMTVVAPFSGVVDEIFPKKGELTGPQTPIVRLINLDNVYVEADVTEIYLPVIEVGTPTTVSFPSLNKEIEASVAQIGNYINPDNRSFKSRINVANSDHSIKPNLLADLKILDFETKGIIIPAGLVQQDQFGEDYVFTIDSSEDLPKVVKKMVTVAKEYNFEVLISKGLEETDVLIDSGARIVKTGDQVKISDQ